MPRKARALVLALLAMAAVVLLPSEAWAVTGPSADYRCSSYVSCWFVDGGTDADRSYTTYAGGLNGQGGIEFWCKTVDASSQVVASRRMFTVNLGVYDPGYDISVNWSGCAAATPSGGGQSLWMIVGATGVVIGCQSTVSGGCTASGIAAPTPQTPVGTACASPYSADLSTFDAGSGPVVDLRVTVKELLTGMAVRLDMPWVTGDYPATPVLRLTPADFVRDDNGTYTHAQTSLWSSLGQSGTPPSKWMFTIVKQDHTPLCRLLDTAGSDPVAGTPPPDNGGADGTAPDTSNGCGFTLNPLSYLKCLFWPTSASTTAFQSRLTTIKTHAPVSIIVSGSALVADVISRFHCEQTPVDGDHVCPGQDAHTTSTTLVPLGTDSGFDLLHEAGHQMQDNDLGRSVYALLKVALWLGFGWFAWARVSLSFGGKDVDTES